MKNCVGTPVEGEDFFGRDVEIATTWRHLDGRNNLLLLAPRRVGKTSLMKRLVHLAPQKGYKALYLTVEGAADEADFVQRFYTAFVNHPDVSQTLGDKAADSWLGRLFKRTKKVGAFGVSVELSDEEKQHWLETLGELLGRLDAPWLLAIDELPLFILNLLREDPSGKRAASFLHDLRSLRQNLPGVRWLIAGSIGLDTVARRHNLTGAINDLQLTSLGPFSRLLADDFLKKLADSYSLDLNAGVRGHILDRLEWLLPYYLQLIFSKVADLSEENRAEENRDRSIQTADIDALFNQLLEPANKNYFDYWRQRLRAELGDPDDGYAITLLNTACQDPQGASHAALQGALGRKIQDPKQRDERLRYLLDVLINDGYLVEENQRHRFRFPLLREYWKRRIAP